MGYWPSLLGQDGWTLVKFFFCEFMDLDFVSVHKLAKKERGQYPAILTEQTWSIKDLLYGFRGNFACGTQRVVPSGQDGSILPVRGASHIIKNGEKSKTTARLTQRNILKTIFRLAKPAEIRRIIICLVPRAGKMNQIVRCDWIPERAKWSHLARSGLPAVSR